MSVTFLGLDRSFSRVFILLLGGGTGAGTAGHPAQLGISQGGVGHTIAAVALLIHELQITGFYLIHIGIDTIVKDLQQLILHRSDHGGAVIPGVGIGYGDKGDIVLRIDAHGQLSKGQKIADGQVGLHIVQEDLSQGRGLQQGGRLEALLQHC